MALTTFKDYVNAINSPTIKTNLEARYSASNDLKAAEIAVILDKLIGEKLTQIDKRIENLETDTGKAFGALFSYLGVEYDRKTGTTVDNGNGLMSKVDKLHEILDERLPSKKRRWWG